MHVKAVYQISFQDFEGRRLDPRVYIGATTQFNRRKSQHISRFKKGKHECKELQKAYDSYPEDSVYFEIIKTCETDAEIFKNEKEIVAKIRTENLFNKFLIAKVKPVIEYVEKKPYNHSSETREKISIAVRAGQTKEGHIRRSHIMKTKLRTPEWNESISRVKQGELNENAKLTSIDVYFIRGMALAGFKRRYLSDAYKVSVNQIRGIEIGKYWKAVEYP